MSDNQALQRIEQEPQSELPTVIKAPITPAQAKIDAVANLTMSAYAKASTLQLTPEEVAALQADFPDEAFQPGAAGKENLIYIEHAHLRDRLNQVFGPGQWSIVPRNRWAEDFTFVNKYKETVEASRVYVEAMLCVRGCFVAEAVGDMVYYKNNDSQNYGDAVEGAKTAALRRCAKELGIGLQAWKKEWTIGWWERRRRGTKQPLGDNSNAKGTAKPPSASTQKPAKPAQATEKTKAWFLAEMRKRFDEQVLLQFFIDRNPAYILPNETLEDIHLDRVPTTRQALDEMVAECAAFMQVEPRVVNQSEQATNTPVTSKTPENTVSPHSSAGSKSRTGQSEKESGHSDGSSDLPEDQPWFDAIVPVPHKGMKRDEYLRAPDTIGELYNLRHDDDQARRRLFGFVHNYEPKGWTGRDGKPRPPSDADKKFRDDLDAFYAWFEENHADECNND